MRSALRLTMFMGTFATIAYKKGTLKYYLQGIEKILPYNVAVMLRNRAENGELYVKMREMIF